MQSVDPQAVTAIIRQVAEEVILPRFQRLSSTEVTEKSPGQLVTVADTEAERQLSRHLVGLLPSSRVVGEEGAAADPTVLDRLDGGDGAVWILDPIDGTTNFANGRKGFAVIVALVVAGRTVQGWIHDPLANRTAIAALGEGSWLDGQRLAVPPEGPMAAMIGSAGWRRNERLGKAVAKMKRQGCVAHDYLDLIEGRLQFAHFRRLHPWDHAAGVLLHHEVGGYGALIDGMPYRPVPLHSGLLLAPGKASWEQLAGLIGE